METLRLQSARFNLNQATIGSLACLTFLFVAYFSFVLYLTGSLDPLRGSQVTAAIALLGALSAGALLGLLSPMRWYQAALLGTVVGTLAAFAFRIVF